MGVAQGMDVAKWCMERRSYAHAGAAGQTATRNGENPMVIQQRSGEDDIVGLAALSVPAKGGDGAVHGPVLRRQNFDPIAHRMDPGVAQILQPGQSGGR